MVVNAMLRQEKVVLLSLHVAVHCHLVEETFAVIVSAHISLAVTDMQMILFKLSCRRSII